jgi:signal transduction histidine kinase
MRTRADELKVQLAWHPADGMPKMMFDPEGLHRAILNLVTNAIDACEDVDEAQVDVTSEYESRDKLARIIVQDNGSGIPAEQLEKMFTIFVSSKGSRGTGLGLSVSQKICKEHGGRILVESESGVGSRFTMEIPVVLPDSGEASPASSDSSVQQTIVP